MAQYSEQFDQSQQQTSIRILRLFGADSEQVRRTAEVLPQGTEVRCVSRGGETLVLLRTTNAEDLEQAERLFRATWQDELYGTGEQTLSVCLIDRLRRQGQSFVCTDSQSGALLEPRMEEVSDADRFFDFGTKSYANPRIRKKLEDAGQAYAARYGGGALAQTVGMLPTACRLAQADFAVGCLPDDRAGLFLLVGNSRGCWIRRVGSGENAALWLMDLLRRAVSEQGQLEKTLRVQYGTELPAVLRPASPSSPSKKPVGKAPPKALSPDGSTSQKPTSQKATSKTVNPPSQKQSSSNASRPKAKGEPPEELPVSIPLPHTAPNADVAEVVFPPPEEKFHPVRLVLGFLFVCLAAAIGAAVVWVCTGGSWESFLEWSGLRQFSLSGASLALVFPSASL